MYKEIPTEKSAREKLTSIYVPNEKERDITSAVLKEYQRAEESYEKSRNEFNGRSVEEETDKMQRAFNSYVPPETGDPDEDWRANTVRPITRNKIISIAAHMTAKLLYPRFVAQNKNDDEDKEAATVMTDLCEWVINNSNYKKSFIQAVISTLTSPAMIMETGFFEVMRKIRNKLDDGKYETKEIIDDILSGFMFNIVPVKELLIANFYEPDIQKQRYIIRRRYVDYLEAKNRYRKSKNIDFVKQGVMTVFCEEDGEFYDIVDDEAKEHLVYEVRYYNRTEDLELVFINGVLMTDPEQPNKRLDKKYPFAKTIYEPLNDGQCFYGKSAASKLSSDQGVIDTLYNMVLDGNFLQLMPPLAHYGSEDIDSSVSVPGMITSFRDPNSKLESILPRSDTRGGMEAIALVEKSMTESSQDNFRAGIGDTTGETARGILQREENAAIQLGLFKNYIGFLVTDLGELIKSDILQFMTVGEAEEITDDMKFRKFILRDKMENGKKVTKEIRFSMDDFTENTDMMQKSFDVLAEEGGLDKKKKIAIVNPSEFRELKFMAYAIVDELTPRSKALEKALSLEAYDRAIRNPVVDQNAVTRDFLFDIYKPGEADKYMVKQQQQMGGEMMDRNGQSFPNPTQNLVGQLTGNNSLGVAASSSME